MSEPVLDHIRKAVLLAVNNVRAGGGPFAAVIVKDGRVIAEGVNRVTATNDPTAHAEIVAIRAACAALDGFQLTGCEIYTSCEPCPMCLGAIYWARPERVYYAATQEDAAAAGFDDRFIYREFAVEPGERKIPMIAVQEADALAPFLAWVAADHKLPY